MKPALEGDGRRDGEGMALVKSDRAEEALRLYDSRPTQDPGQALAFVIRAVSDLAQWDNAHVEFDAVLGKIGDDFERRSKLSSQSLSSLYWVTRLALQRGDARLTSKHKILLEVVFPTLTGPGMNLMAPIVAVAEAGDHPIVDDRMRQVTFPRD